MHPEVRSRRPRSGRAPGKSGSLFWRLAWASGRHPHTAALAGLAAGTATLLLLIDATAAPAGSVVVVDVSPPVATVVLAGAPVAMAVETTPATGAVLMPIAALPATPVVATVSPPLTMEVPAGIEVVGVEPSLPAPNSASPLQVPVASEPAQPDLAATVPVAPSRSATLGDEAAAATATDTQLAAVDSATADTTGGRQKPAKKRKADQRSRADAESVSSLVNALSGDPGLQSASVLVVDQADGTPLYAKNDRRTLPIASITKLMTALVVLESGAPLSETITISDKDRDRLKGTSSRLPVGTKLSRESLLRLALMASENRAAAALGRSYPGGTPAFVAAMNRKAQALGMRSTKFADASGLNKRNVSTAQDLVRLVQASWRNPALRRHSTAKSLDVKVGRQRLTFNNTNPLLRAAKSDWKIGLSKTGYISESGHCLVMRATVAARDVVIVLLNSQGRYTRVGDANRVRRWMEAQLGNRRANVG